MAEAADSAFDHAQSCSDGQEGRLSLRDHCVINYAAELRSMGSDATISACRLLDDPCGCAGLPELVGDCGDIYLPPATLIGH